MRCLLRLELARLIACLAVLLGSASALGSPLPPELNNPHAIPKTERILFNGPFDPQRKVNVFAPVGDVPRASRRALDKRVLKYLREMIGICRRKNRRDMVWYYEEAWELASAHIYGALPPRKQDLAGTFYQPANPTVPQSFRPPTYQWPMRKIVKLNEHPHGFTTMKWEMLECGHELMCAPGYSVPAKSRRCIYCAAEALAKNKKPAATVSAIARSKAVGA